MNEFRVPGVGDVPKVAQWLIDTGMHLAVSGPALLKATSLPPDTGGVEVHVSGGGHSDPTGTEACGAVDFERESKLTIEQNTLRAYMADAVQVCDALMATVNRLSVMLGPPKPVVDDDLLCEEGCGRLKAKGRGPNCERCYRWKYEHKDASGVRPLRVPTALIRKWRDEDAKGKPGRQPAPGHVSHPDPEAA